MRESQFVVRLDISAEQYHSLRSNRDFDHFCAAKQGAKFVVHTEGAEAEGSSRRFIEGSYHYPLRSPFRQLLAREWVCVQMRMGWHPQKFDADNAAIFATIPDVFGGIAEQHGTCYIVPISEAACEM